MNGSYRMAASAGWESTQGTNHRLAKLDDDGVRLLRECSDEELAIIASQYGITLQYAISVRRGKRWAHVRRDNGSDGSQ